MNDCCWHKHYLHKHYQCCTKFEKLKRVSFNIVAYIGIAIVIAAGYALATFRWSL